MNWKERYASKLISPEEAARKVKSGNRVRVTMAGGQTPRVLCQALAARAEELHGVTIDITFSQAGDLGLLGPGTEGSWDTFTCFATGKVVNEKLNTLDEQVNYVPMNPHAIGYLEGSRHREEFIHRWLESDVCFVVVTPPDRNGMVSFANNLWHCRPMARNARLVVGEVCEGLPVVPGGDNWMPMDAIHYLVDGGRRETTMAQEPMPPEEMDACEVACSYMAELIDNGDTVMFGGAISRVLFPHLASKEDLGLHTEVVMPVDLIRKGVFNGKCRNLLPGKVSSTAVSAVTPEDREWIDGNPIFDMRDMGWNNNPRYICQNDNLVAINSPLEVTLFGEIGIERVGPKYLRGFGGQVEFIEGALLSKNGRSIHGVSSRRKNKQGEWNSTIVPQFAYPGVASIPRQLADFVVTEYGVARLMGKTERERASELIEIAHPDYHSWLREEAKKLFGTGKRYFT